MNILILSAAMLVWGGIHSLLASLQVKEWFSRATGERYMRFYRLAYNLFSLLTFLPILWLTAALPDRILYVIPWPWLGLTLTGQLAAAVLLGISLFQTDLFDFIGLSALISSRPPERSHLVVTGLYRWVRHPIYSAGLFFIWLTPVMTVNLLTLYAAATVYIILGAYYEERKLLREFGVAYADYRASTPMFLPYPRRRNR